MQAALHFRAHKPHETHLSLSIVILKIEKRDKKPNTVPTGQIVLQYVLPFFQANMNKATNVTAAMMKVGRLRIHTSVV